VNIHRPGCSFRWSTVPIEHLPMNKMTKQKSGDQGMSADQNQRQESCKRIVDGTSRTLSLVLRPNRKAIYHGFHTNLSHETRRQVKTNHRTEGGFTKRWSWLTLLKQWTVLLDLSAWCTVRVNGLAQWNAYAHSMSIQRRNSCMWTHICSFDDLMPSGRGSKNLHDLIYWFTASNII